MTTKSQTPLTKEAILKYLDTKPLLLKLNQLEDDLEKSLREEAEFKSLNYGFLGNDCAEAKRIEAELAVVAEGSNDTQRKAWLQRQRSKNEELLRVLLRQKNVAFELDNIHIKVEITKKRLEGLKAVLALKTAQINFLA